ncbi:MAG: hypothetical protein JSR46_03770 [Verrucomicrobia bacterium]|nr:hypothetical protein [Verrucomicrobiota bacterium]
MLYTRSRSYLVALSVALGASVAMPTLAISAQPVTNQVAKCTRCNQRKLPPKKEYAIYKKVAKLSDKTRKAMKGEATPQQVKARICGGGDKINFARIAHHIDNDTSRLGDMIAIKDGSEWTVSESDRYIVQNWAPNTKITFAPNLSSWSFIMGEPMHKYRAVNLETGESVEVNLSQGPFIHKKESRRIKQINKSTGEVRFDNGTAWRCAYNGPVSEVFHDWKVGDFVITGINDSWYALNKQDIIINVSADNWLPAQRAF